MGALANASSLMRDDVLLDLVMASLVYQAREVLLGPVAPDHDETRRRFAKEVVLQPARYAEQVRRILSCDPEIALLGDSYEDIPELTLITKVVDLWTGLALLTEQSGSAT